MSPRDADVAPSNRFLLLGTGVVLFLFIPLVLFLFVRHPAPLGVSLGAGVLLIAQAAELG